MKKFLSFLLTFVMLFSLAMPAMAAEGTRTIYFENTANWTTVNAYAWDAENNALLGGWPGTAMTNVEGNIWSIEVSTDAVNMIFNDGSNQTADLTIPTDGKNLYNSGSGSWSTYGSTGDTSGPTVNGGTSGDVSASFNPGEIKFTGMEYYGDEATYDAATNTYTVVIPADAVRDARLGITIVGTNLDVATGSTHLKVKCNDSLFGEDIMDTQMLIEQEFVYCMNTRVDGYWATYQYSNDGGETWSDPLRTELKHGYSVTVNESANGTVTADKTLAAPGDTVSLTVAPAVGYMLDKENTTITDAYGDPVTLSENNTFEMPTSTVTITPVFKQMPPQSITVNASDNGSVTADLTEATPGTTVTLTVAPADDCRLVTLTVNDGAVEVTKVNDTTYTFVMPNAEVSVTATFEKIPRTVTIEASENGTLNADKQTTTKGETVTLTWTAAEGYELDKITVTDANGDEVAVDQGLTTCTFTMPASDVTVKAVFEVIRIVSADLVWGSLAYTYTDENGWQNQSSDADAGTVTVTNTGNVPFNAKATYSAEMDYMNIRGTFDNGATTLAAGENQSFKLTLHNRPDRVLSGQKIGTVTVHISETEFTDYVTVTNELELLNAIADGSSIKFGNDITSSEWLEINSAADIDLNGFTISGFGLLVNEDADVSISGGTIDLYPRNNGGKLTISNCTINGGSVYAIHNIDGTTTLTNTTLSGGGSLLVDGGTLICDFDPSARLSDYSKATDNGDGTWTVTAK